MTKSSSPSPPTSDTAPESLATQVGLSHLPFELLDYLFATWLTSPIDQIALGRSCKWLYQIIQSTEAWRVLSNPTSPLSAFAHSLLGHPLALLTPLKDASKFAICLPLTRTGTDWPWAHCHNAGKYSVHARPLVVRELPPNHNSTQQRAGADDQAGPVLPLFLTQGHFDSAFALLQAQARRILIADLQSGTGSGEGIPSIPRAMITCSFPRIVHNMATKLVLADSTPTAQDLEAFVQVHLVWRAMVQRFSAQGAHRWISAELQRRVNVLQGGGKAAQDEPLMELVALLHVCGGERECKEAWTWPKVALRVVEENTIRLLEYARYCEGCEWRLEEEVPIHQFSIQVGNELASRKLDGYGFVHWPLVLFHLQFMRTLRSIPNLDNTSVFAGRFVDKQRLEPGRLARLLQVQLDQRIRQQPTVDSWSSLMQRLGSPPMEPCARDKWLAWCDRQATSRGQSDHHYRDRCTCCGRQCPICALENSESDRDDGPPSTTAGLCIVSSVTFSRYLLNDTASVIQQSTGPVPEPSLSFIALNRRSALLGVYTHDGGTPVSSPAGIFPPASIAAHGPNGNSGTSLHLDLLPSQVAFVAVIATDSVSKSLLHAITSPPARFVYQYLDGCDSPRRANETLNSESSRLAYVCCRNQDGSGTWRLDRANGLGRYGEAVRWSKHAWVIPSAAGAAATVEQSVDIAQEWVVEYAFTCQERGLDQYVTDLDANYWVCCTWYEVIRQFLSLE